LLFFCCVSLSLSYVKIRVNNYQKGGIMAKKKNRESPKIYRSKIGFDDIVGHKQIKERLKAIIKIVKNPKALERFDTPPPKGLLIYGPISVGKSMLAKAFSKEAGIPYYEISGSKLFELTYIKEVYEAASKHAPCIVILEDIDIKGIMQGTITNVSFSDIAKVLESTDEKVFTIATSESLDTIDPVLTAPGKLDFLLEVSRLDKDARRFLEKGNKVKVSLRFRRNEMGDKTKALNLMNRIAEEVSDIAVISSEPKARAIFLDMMLESKTKKK